MEHTELTDELRERIAIYALDGLDETSAHEIETHLTGCQVCLRELAELKSTLALLSCSLPSMSPNPQLKARLFERVRGSTASAVEAVHALPMTDFSSLSWQPSGHPGVSFYQLRLDEASGTITVLVKAQAGSTYPAHLHPGGEECLLLQGGFRDRWGEYRAPAYVYYQPGSVHHDFQVLEGEECIFLAIAHGGIQFDLSHT